MFTHTVKDGKTVGTTVAVDIAKESSPCVTKKSYKTGTEAVTTIGDNKWIVEVTVK